MDAGVFEGEVGIGGTPLARAAYEGHVEVVELLIATTTSKTHFV